MPDNTHSDTPDFPCEPDSPCGSCQRRSQKIPESGLRSPVLGYAECMEALLKTHDHRGGWLRCDDNWLWELAFKQLLDLRDAIRSGYENGISHKAVNVGNYCMMIHDRHNLRRGDGSPYGDGRFGAS